MTQENALYEKEMRDKLNASPTLDENEIALKDRLNGRQPTLDICGQTYYVNWHLETLERQGDFMTRGIGFNELEDYYNEDFTQCELPYNKKTHQLDEDFDPNQNLIELPKDVVIVAFPPPQVMDPVGYSRTDSEFLENLLKETPQKAHFKAKVLKGEESWLVCQVNSNRKERGLPALKEQRKSRKMKR